MGEGVRVGTAKCTKATEKAILVELEDFDGRELWVPQSQVHEDSEVFDDDENAEGTLVVTPWFAKKEGLY